MPIYTFNNNNNNNVIVVPKAEMEEFAYDIQYSPTS